MRILNSSSFVALLVVTVILSSRSSLSYTIPTKFLSITTRIPKCLSVTSTKGTTVSIAYSTPDIVSIPSDYNHARSSWHDVQPHQGGSGSNGGKKQQEDDYLKSRMEHYRNRRMAMEQMQMGAKRWDSHLHPRRIDDMKSDSSNIFVIVDNVSEPSYSMPFLTDNAGDDHDQQRIYESFEIVQREGKIKYTLSHYDHVRICIKSMTASQWKPTFFAILVKEVDEIMEMDMDMNVVEDHSEEKRQQEQMEIDKGREHLRWLERELHKMLGRVNSIERACHSSKETHGEFYSQSVEMHGRFKWFAAVQIVILLIMGFLNAKTILQSLRKKGVIYY